uniref:RING-type E3 ubiquitin transferase n=1 Tax=Bubo bubo TaxID=30461 RepID=A0A8C0IC80_BUBBB
MAEGPGTLCFSPEATVGERFCFETPPASSPFVGLAAFPRQKKTASHAVVELENTEDCSQAGKPLFCPSHPTEELRLFCEQCDQPVCQDCVADRHRQHPYAFTSNVIHRHGNALRELLKDTQQHMGILEDVLGQIDDMGSAVRSHAEDVAAEICLFASGYVKAIEEHRDRLLKQLEALKVQKENLLHLQKAQLQQLLLDMRTGVEFTEHLLTSGSDLEILITKGVVASRLAKLNSVAYDTHPSVDDGIRFSPQERAGQCCGYEVFGAILNKVVDPARCTLHGEDLQNARQNQLTGFNLLCNDTTGERMRRGGEAVRVTITHKDKKDWWVPTVCDNGDGTYHISYSPEEPGLYGVCVYVKGQHVQGSPFTLMVKNKFREHRGVFHCCTFCSSGGQKAARCACGGTMPGGYQGCGHGHKGHPGCPHWSCCGQVKESSECLGGPPGSTWQRSLLRTVVL